MCTVQPSLIFTLLKGMSGVRSMFPRNISFMRLSSSSGLAAAIAARSWPTLAPSGTDTLKSPWPRVRIWIVQDFGELVPSAASAAMPNEGSGGRGCWARHGGRGAGLALKEQSGECCEGSPIHGSGTRSASTYVWDELALSLCRVSRGLRLGAWTGSQRFDACQNTSHHNVPEQQRCGGASRDGNVPERLPKLVQGSGGHHDVVQVLL